MKRFWQNIISVAIGLVSSFVVAVLLGIFNQERFIDSVGVLMDGAFISAVVALGITGLIYAANEGVFDMFSFAVRLLVEIPFKRPEERKFKDFYEYKQSKGDRKVSLKAILIVGLTALTLALITAVLYYTLR